MSTAFHPFGNPDGVIYIRTRVLTPKPEEPPKMTREEVIKGLVDLHSHIIRSEERTYGGITTYLAATGERLSTLDLILRAIELLKENNQ